MADKSETSQPKWTEEGLIKANKAVKTLFDNLEDVKKTPRESQEKEMEKLNADFKDLEVQMSKFGEEVERLTWQQKEFYEDMRKSLADIKADLKDRSYLEDA